MKKSRPSSTTKSNTSRPGKSPSRAGKTKSKANTPAKSTKPAQKIAPLKKASLKRAPLAKPASPKPTGPKAAGSKTAKTPKAPVDNREAVMAKRIIKALEDLKGKNIVSLDVKHLTDVMDVMIIVSGTSNRHVKSLADHAVLEMKKAGYRCYGLEGEDAGEWVLVDFGGVVLHVMQPHIREFYDLERLWGTPPADSE